MLRSYKNVLLYDLSKHLTKETQIMMTTIGFINKKLYTDIRSHEVFVDNDKTYAVRVEKRVGKVKPEFIEGGFCAHCVNQNEVWENGDIVRVGKPFEVIERNGYYGYFTDCGERYVINRKLLERDLKDIADRGLVAQKIDEDEYQIEYWVFKPTKNGTPRKKFVKMGTLEKTCKWFYDYNF